MRRVALCFSLSLLAAGVLAESGRYDAAGADGVRHRIDRVSSAWEIQVLGAGVDRPDQAVFVAVGSGASGGSALLPSGKGKEGAPVWLPFGADLLLTAADGGKEKYLRRWTGTQWGPRQSAGDAFSVTSEPAQLTLRIPDALIGPGKKPKMAVYLKDLAADGGMGRMYGAFDRAVASGTGEQTIRYYLQSETGKSGVSFRRAGRTDPAAPRTRIYQLLPRLFGNTNETRAPSGTIEQNGVGKFSAINDAALGELKAMGFTHLWLTGVMQQATATDYSSIGEPADDTDLLKGMAGSPYAIRDYFDVSPDYADDPARRLDEFKALVARIHEKGMKVIVDFVPNHVARSYASTVKPDLTFGADDDRNKFFDSGNNFYYLTGDSEAEGNGPPLRLPTVDGDGRATSATVQAAGGGDGLFAGEKDFGRVTGNNVVSWSPGADTWYETVKLNYGYDFTGRNKAPRRYPHGKENDAAVPDTWKKMDEVIAYWQALGVDGFRADMAHMVPPEFWRWLLARSRQRDPDIYWIAEAYDGDPSKVLGGDADVAVVTGGAVMPELLNAGFDAVYDDPSYDALKELYDDGGSANEVDAVRGREFFADNAVRYAENHDEVRLAAPGHWGGIGPAVGRPVSALLFGLSRGPVMVYHGQEVGEPATGAEGFGRDDGRTSIYDYWSMPEFAKWVNGGKFDGGRLSEEQKSLREFYRRLLAAVDQPAFRDGVFYPLNPENRKNPAYGRVRGAEPGHWLYSYLRYDVASGQRMLVVVNLHPRETFHDLRVRIPRSAMRFLGWDTIAGSKSVPVLAQDRLGEVPGASAEIATTPAEVEQSGLPIKELQPLTAAYYELSSVQGAVQPAP